MISNDPILYGCFTSTSSLTGSQCFELRFRMFLRKKIQKLHKTVSFLNKLNYRFVQLVTPDLAENFRNYNKNVNLTWSLSK